LYDIPWYADCDARVPVDADPIELLALGPALARALDSEGIRLLDLHSRAIFPGALNELIQQRGSKGAALSQLTLQLVSQVMEPLGEGTISVVCDKHGGRNRYARLLSEHFPQWLIEIWGEGRRQSVYCFGPAERRAQFRFQMKAESCLPVALASMASKYLRELAMRALNDFWAAHVPGLRPTAGYPRDARRFKADIAEIQTELEIEDRVLWRKK
jgi:hypothetical protein